MGTPQRSRELLWADVVLERGLVPVSVVAKTLQRVWGPLDGETVTLSGELVDAGVGRDVAEAVDDEVDRLIDEAGGDARLALTRRGRVGEAIRLTMAAQPKPGRRLADPDTGDLRTADEDRFSEFFIAGEGGMGVVYMALDRELNRFVALKMIRPPNPDGTPADAPFSPLDADPPSLETVGADRYAELTQRFLQEAWITGGLEHPGIVPVYELGQTIRGVPFYTMRFVSGHRTLRNAIDEASAGGIAERLALIEPFLKICDAIEFAHSRGIIHRDLKPQNVALGEFGEVLVLDWGLARADDADASDDPWKEHVREFRATSEFETQLSAVGTPGYMAPEAALGKTGSMDARSDVYSLGAVLYEILTGRLPHEFDSLVEWVEKLVHEPIQEPARVDPSVPAGLSALAAAALATDQDERPAHAGELADRIRAWQVADAEARELDRLEREARDALSTAREARGDRRLRGAERAALLLRQVAVRRPDSDTVSALLAEAEVLRHRGLRERTWQMIRWPLAAAALLIGAVVLTMVLVERARRAGFRDDVDGRFRQAGVLLDQIRVDDALAAVADARDALDTAEAEDAFDAAAVTERRIRHLELVCGAYVQKADVAGLAMAAADVLSSARSTTEQNRFRTIVARALSRLGVFEAIPLLLGGAALASEEGRACLCDAYLRMGDREKAREILASGERPDVEALWFLDRFSPLARIPVEKARSVAVVRLDGRNEIVTATQGGGLFRWDASTRKKSEVLVRERLQGPAIVASWRSGCVVATGIRQENDQTRPESVVAEIDVRDGSVRTLRAGLVGCPRSLCLDVDGDGALEYVFSYAAAERGLEILDGKGALWPKERLGDLIALSLDNRLVDVYGAAVVAGQDGSRLLLVATANWDLGDHGYRVLRYRWDPNRRSFNRLPTPRLGSILALSHADLDGDGAASIYICSSYSPYPEHGTLIGEFLPPGVYELDPETAAATPVRSERSAYFWTASNELKAAPAFWQFLVLGSVQCREEQQALVFGSYVGPEQTAAGQASLELMVRSAGQSRAFVVPGIQPSMLPEGVVTGDVLPAAEGEELIVVCHDEVVILGDERDGPVSPGACAADAPRLLRPVDGDENVIWLLAEGLRGAGHADAAARIYGTFDTGAESGSARAERWLRAAACWLEKNDAPRALRAVSNAAGSNGISVVERLWWEARIATNDFRPDDALQTYRLAAEALQSAPLKTDFERRVRSERAREIAEDIETELGRLDVAQPGVVHRFDLAGASGLPGGWQSSRPRIVEPSIDGTGLRVALNGMRDDFVGFELDAGAPRRIRAWARLVVEEEAWGSQLCLGVSQSKSPSTYPSGTRADAAWIALERGDGMPRGLGAGARIAGPVVRQVRLDHDGGYLWRWGRPLYLEITYDGRVSAIHVMCRDEISGETVGRATIPAPPAMQGGKYRIGIWGAPARTEYSDIATVVLQELGCEISADRQAELVDPPAPPPSVTAFEQAWDGWVRGDLSADAAAAQLVEGIESDKELAELLVGPRPRTPTALVEALLDLEPALADELFRESDDRTLIALDAPLLARLYRSGRVDADDKSRKRVIARALSAVGDLAGAWPLIKRSEPGAGATSVSERLRGAPYLYEDRDALEAFLRPLLDGDLGAAPRCNALKVCLRCALAREDDDGVREYLRRLLEDPGLEPESLNDDPAIRWLIEGAR